jgi:hypothetical protein
MAETPETAPELPDWIQKIISDHPPGSTLKIVYEKGSDPTNGEEGEPDA